VYPHPIFAAFAGLALDDMGTLYDSRTAEPVGTTGIASTVIAASSRAGDFWLYDASGNKLRHFQPYDYLFADGFGD
jgi:hypothetical protein